MFNNISTELHLLKKEFAKLTPINTLNTKSFKTKQKSGTFKPRLSYQNL